MTLIFIKSPSEQFHLLDYKSMKGSMLKNKLLFRFISLLIACLMMFASSQPAFTASNQTTRASVASDGVEGEDGDSNEPAISADGRYVAFSSRATNLVAGDANGVADIFVHDRQTGETTRVSVDSNGVEGNGHSYSPAISGDGRFVAFYSGATNLVAGDTNEEHDIFVHDRQTRETTRVSVDSAAVQGDQGSFEPAISGDGRYVAFRSSATNLVAGDTNTRTDIFVHDRQTGETTRVSVDSSGVQGNSYSYQPAISGDGSFVAFLSEASNLVVGDTNARNDIFVHDRQTRETTRVSVDSAAVQGNNSSFEPAISADGRFVAFYSHATNLVVGDTNNTVDIFVHDHQTGQTTRVSVESDGLQGNDGSVYPSISADGRFVAFESLATNMVAEDTNGVRDIFVHDRQTGETTRVSVDSDGLQGNNVSYSPSISSDGLFVAFTSLATNLVAGDTNSAEDIFVYDRQTYLEVSVEQASNQPDPTNVSPVHFTATFTKPIDPTAFDGSHVQLGGTAGATTAVVTEIVPSDGTTFNIAVSGMTDYGTVTASLPSGVIEDLEGYWNAASTSTDNTIFYLIFNYLPLIIR